MKTEVIRLRITPELKEQLRIRAESENRTMSNLIETLIRREIEEKPSDHNNM